MRLIKFRIKNYKSIVDSGDCYIEEGVTIFAGKNEAGKTAILEALEAFNIDKDIEQGAVPLFIKGVTPEITLSFTDLSAIEVAVLTKEVGFEPLNKANGATITFIKKYPNQYFLDPSTITSLYGDNPIAGVQQEVHASLKSLQNILKEFPSAYAAIPVEETDRSLWITKLSDLPVLIEGDSTLEASPEIKTKAIASAKNLIAAVEKLIKTELLDQQVTKVLQRFLPNFILFRSFEETFPSEIPLADIEANDLIKDLGEISGLDLEIIRSDSSADKIKHHEQLNLQAKKEYSRFWSQDFTNLHFWWDSEKLFFFIKEDNNFYDPQIRSQGKRWHLAFYIRVSARSQEKKNNILLIDEPGIFLHASAQDDILNKLEDIAQNQHKTVLFTTHSPYLIRADELQKIRLVKRGNLPKQIDGSIIPNPDPIFLSSYTEKTHRSTGEKYYQIKKKTESMDEDELNSLKSILTAVGCNLGTVIESKIHKVADKETLTPILTAIGLELTQGIVNVDKKENVVTEGQSDIYYLNAFKRLSSDAAFNFVFGGGAGNMPIVGTVLSGWGCNVLYLYDNDQARENAETNLKREWLVSLEEMLNVVEVEGGSIEDIFSRNDFKKYVLEDESLEYESSNSAFIKAQKREKVLIAKNFLQKAKANSVELDDETRRNISNLFTLITEKFRDVF